MNRASRSWQWLVRNRRSALALLGFVLVLGVVLGLTHHWWDEIKTALERTNVYVFVALFLVLPLAGVSIALLYVVVGARFGGPTALAVVAGATAFHLAATHVIANSFLRAPVSRVLRRRGHRLPRLAERQPTAFSLLGALVPGIPYAARNYLLALSGVPFRIYAVVCWPIYVIRSGVALFFGEWAGELTLERGALLLGILGTKVAICAGIVWYLHRRYTVESPGASPRHPRAA